MRRAPTSILGQVKAGRRRGNASLMLIAFMGITVPALFMTMNIWRITEGRVQQQRYGDAIAHAAVAELTRQNTSPDRSPLLYGVPAEIQTLCQTNCIAEAQKYAGGTIVPGFAPNWVDGVALTLDTATAQKDVKFGKYDVGALAPTFTAIDPTTAITDASTLDKRSINAVRVETYRTTSRNNSVPLFGPSWIGYTNAKIVTYTTAVLDRRVIGFRIQDNLVAATYQTIPLAPVALKSESTNPPPIAAPSNPLTWEYQVERLANAADGSTSPIAYQTMIVNVPTSANSGLASLNSRLLKIGTTNVAGMNGQLLTGITAPQMVIHKMTNPDLILGTTVAHTVAVPELSPPAPASGDYATMQTYFEKLRDDKTERAWPLFTTSDGTTVTVTGFVAARIITVTPQAGSGGYISLELQPTLLETPTAFTDMSNRLAKTGPTSPYVNFTRLVNPYLCRVRLVD